MENNNPSNFQTGDLVVGSRDPNKSVYSATGVKLVDDGVSVFGDPKHIRQLSEDFTKTAMRHGGKPLETKKDPVRKIVGKKSVKKNKTTQASIPVYDLEPLRYTEELYEPVKPRELLNIHFENSFGNIRAKVEHLVENSLAFMLIFTDEDAMVFEPRIGETLVLRTPNKERHEVYYPGVTFDLPETDKKLMVLFKVPASEEISE